MKNVHIISHTHWDREWYMSFEYHRYHLVKLIDDCLELFDNDPDFKSFHLDGHSALLEDYLEIKPQNREKVEKYVKEGRFSVGPWYVLQDEFLTSSEANIRNLLVGMRLSKSFGKVTKVGYFPDAFGNAGQMPQILKQAGMKAVAFGRGVKPTGLNNEVTEGYYSQYSELYWESPDGSSIPAILFANWYCNGMELPSDGNRERWDAELEKVERYASTDELLLMNGCDNQPVQKDVTKAIKAASENYPEYNFIHSNFEKYAEDVCASLPENISTVKGELTSQDTDGWLTLTNTASSHVDLKVMNKKGEILLENVAEPLSVIAARLGKEYPHEMLEYAWKTLMKNHTHDAICTCSVDDVTDEMRTRFNKSRQAAESIINDNLRFIEKHIDKSGFEDCEVVVAVLNTTGKSRSMLVNKDVTVTRRYHGDNRVLHGYSCEAEENMYTGDYVLVDNSGREIPCNAEKRRIAFGYDLPEDSFRKPYIAEVVTISFEAECVPAMGYSVFGLKKAEAKSKGSLITKEYTMENDYLKAEINGDGTVSLLDKTSGTEFNGLLRLEDVGDVGSEYTFVPAKDDKPILSGNAPAKIELVCDEEFRAEYKITTEMEVPAHYDEQAAWDMEHMTWITDRTGGRGKESVKIEVSIFVSLAKSSKRLDVRVEFENTAKDHRLRMLFPTGLKATTHRAEAIFEAVTRNNEHKSTWVYPSGCDRQHGFCMIEDDNKGLAVLNIGLYEYEVLKDNSIAVTLVRSTREMGDWGIFPTELSQQQKKLTLDLSVVPYTNENTVFDEALAFAVPQTTVQLLKNDDSSYKNDELLWSGDGLRLTAFKGAQESDDLIMRWVNFSENESMLTVKKSDWIDNLYYSNVLEEKGEAVTEANGVWEIKVKPFEIITFGSCK